MDVINQGQGDSPAQPVIEQNPECHNVRTYCYESEFTRIRSYMTVSPQTDRTLEVSDWKAHKTKCVKCEI